jgi:RecG-like helicase
LKENVVAIEEFEYASSNLSDLSDEQGAIANEIIRSAERNSPKLMFLQGSAGTGKTHTVQEILLELHRRGFRCLVSATTGIAAVQYQSGQTLHSLFSLGIYEKGSSHFTSNIGQGTA